MSWKNYENDIKNSSFVFTDNQLMRMKESKTNLNIE